MYLIFLIVIIIAIVIYEKFAMRNTVKIRSKKELNCDSLTTDWSSFNNWETMFVPSTKKLISNEDKQAYYALLKDIDEVLNANNIKYVLTAGTLLGSYRHGAIIPFDDDGDISIRYEDHDRFKALQKEFKKRGIDLQNGCLACWAGFYSEICKYLNDISKTDDKYSPAPMKKPCKNTRYFAALKRGKLHIDVFHLIPIYDKDNKKMYTIYGNNRLISEKQANDMFNTVKCPFGPLSLSCPSNTKELLCHHYNNNLQFPTKAGIENKNLIPGMWSSSDDKVPHVVKEGDDYVIKNFR